MAEGRDCRRSFCRTRDLSSLAFVFAVGQACTSGDARKGMRTPAPLIAAKGDASGPTGATPPPRAVVPASTPLRVPVRVGNHDPRGVEHQPDYNGKALQLRHSLVHDLPAPLPSAKVACGEMLDAARRYYRLDETDSRRRASLMARMQATHERDLAACVQETSPAAALCTAILLRRQHSEFPWALDQCSRAFR